jgi:hypothetical protein
MALAGLRRRDWPFAGRLGILERDWRGAEEVHVFDRWRYLGSVQDLTDLTGLDGEAAAFDPDVYRILLRILERSGPGLQLIELDRR